MKQSNTTRNRTEHFVGELDYSYDSLNDLLYVYKKKANVYSNVMIGDFHLEFDKNSDLVGMEILNASDNLGEYGIPKEYLTDIKKVELKVVSRGNSLFVVLMVTSLNQTKSATITMNHLDSSIIEAIASA